MKNQQIVINEIHFESNDNQACIMCTIHEGTLNYESELLVSSSSINRILNQVAKENISFDPYNYMQSTLTSSGNTYYFIKFPENIINRLQLAEIKLLDQNLTQICA